MPDAPPYPVPAAIIMVVVIAASAIAALAITAWLLHQVARRAIDKATPDSVASVILALGALAGPLRAFLPWSGRGTADGSRQDEQSREDLP
jgi:flagellar basal body-associated protein FliL